MKTNIYINSSPFSTSSVPNKSSDCASVFFAPCCYFPNFSEETLIYFIFKTPISSFVKLSY